MTSEVRLEKAMSSHFGHSNVHCQDTSSHNCQDTSSHNCHDLRSQRHMERPNRISGLQSQLSPYFESFHLSYERHECSHFWQYQALPIPISHWLVPSQGPREKAAKWNHLLYALSKFQARENGSLMKWLFYVSELGCLLNYIDNQTKGLLCVSNKLSNLRD